MSSDKTLRGRKQVKKLLSIILSLVLVLSCFPVVGSTDLQQAFAEDDLTQQDGENPSQEGASQLQDNFGGRLKTEDEIREQQESGDGLVEYVERSDGYEDQYYEEVASAKNSLSSATDTENLPSKVDLRDRGVVGTIKNQHSDGTCWAFAANAAAETSLASATNSDPVNLSAYQTGWFSRGTLPQDLDSLYGTERTQAGEGNYRNAGSAGLSYGGNNNLAACEFMAGIGVAKETDIPYSTSKESLDDSKRRMSIARLKKQNNLSFKRYDGDEDPDLSNIKSEINKGRGVCIQTFMDTSTKWNGVQVQYYSKELASKTTFSELHEACIIGYDDTFSADKFAYCGKSIDGKWITSGRPPKDGAFIVKNSWGENWGSDGYWYMSYYDVTYMGACSLEFDTENYTGEYIYEDTEIIDQYDYIMAQGVNKLSNLSDSGDGESWYSNVFTASGKQSLHHIGTYYCHPGGNLNYRVYRLKSNATSPSDVVTSLSSPDARGTYVNPYEGYVSIKLDSAIEIQDGEKYAIWFSQSDSSGKYSFPINYELWGSPRAIVNKGESFWSSGSETNWNDYYSYWKEQYSSAVNNGFDNFCVKGYATLEEPIETPHTLKITEKSGNGTLKVNNSSSSDSSWELAIEENATVALSWSSVCDNSDSNLKLIKSIKINGTEQTINTDKSKWSTANSEYKRRMRQNATMVTYDKVKGSTQSFTFNTSNYLSSSNPDISLVVEFQEVVPVYRLYNMVTSEHLFTTDKSEYDSWVAKCKKDADFWIGEGIDWFAPATSTSTVTRLYNPALGAMGRTSHYYTSDANEIKELTTKYGWKDEASDGKTFASGGSIPIYTCYNEALGSAHHYTSSKTEWQGLKKHGWNLEESKSIKNGKTVGVFQALMSAK